MQNEAIIQREKKKREAELHYKEQDKNRRKVVLENDGGLLKILCSQ